jgi:hypothetical protein
MTGPASAEEMAANVIKNLSQQVLFQKILINNNNYLK